MTERNATPDAALDADNLVTSWLEAEAELGRDAIEALTRLNAAINGRFRPSSLEVWQRGERPVPTKVQLYLLQQTLYRVLKAADVLRDGTPTPDMQPALWATIAASICPASQPLNDAMEARSV